MNQPLSSEDIVTLSRQIAALYIQEAPMQTLGEWVLTKFYSLEEQYSLPNARDFCGAERTYDGRIYLSGMIRSGSLSAEPLLAAVKDAKISEKAMMSVI